MLYKDFEKNCQLFSQMIKNFPVINDQQIKALLNHYIKQNLNILNDIFTISIDNLKKLQHAKTPNDVVCTQAYLTNEISNKLALSAQHFMNASLGQIADYNEWLKAHCDLSTD